MPVKDDSQRRLHLLLGAVAVAVLAVLPLFAKQYTITVIVRMIYFGFLAMSLGLPHGPGGG